MQQKIDGLLVPKLRFPEFLDAGEWESKRLDDVAPLQRGFDLPSDQIKPGNIPVVYSNGVQNFHSMGMAKAPGLVTGRSGTIGKIHFIEEGDYWPHNTSLWVTSFKDNFPKFIYYLYKSIGTTRFASGSGVPTLNRNYVHAYRSCLPPSISEQKKIADCLSSIGDRITLESQKLDTLKAHKKGLMQQLFPAEGETLPKLRFPEFLDSGDWEEQKLGSLVEIFSGDAPSSYKLSSAYGCPYVKVEDMNNCSKYQSISREYADKSTKNLPTGSVIFPKRGAAIMGNKVRIAAVPFYIDSNMMALFPQKKGFLLPEFLYYLVLTQQLSKIADTSSIPQINNKHIIAYTVKIPSPPEQQKIADCLSSLDELIAAQAQAIDTLKTHKKGLMQQLFPSVEEVKG